MSSSHGNQKVSDSDIIQAMQSIEGPFVTAGELEGRLPITRHAINKRLKDLHQSGQVETKKASGNWIGWWVQRSDD